MSNTLTINVLLTLLMRAVIPVFLITTLMVFGAIQLPIDDAELSENKTPTYSSSVVSNDVTEAENYTLVYHLDIPDIVNHNSDGVNYAVDNSSQVNFSFDRVAYHLELQKDGEERVYVYVSFPTLTGDVEEIGIPYYNTGIVYQQLIEDLHISSNHPSLSSLSSSDSGVIEFWPSNYVTGNDIAVPGADSNSYDFGDGQSSGAGYGSTVSYTHLTLPTKRIV